MANREKHQTAVWRRLVRFDAQVSRAGSDLEWHFNYFLSHADVGGFFISETENVMVWSVCASSSKIWYIGSPDQGDKLRSDLPYCRVYMYFDDQLNEIVRASDFKI